MGRARNSYPLREVVGIDVVTVRGEERELVELDCSHHRYKRDFHGQRRMRCTSCHLRKQVGGAK